MIYKKNGKPLPKKQILAVLLKKSWYQRLVKQNAGMYKIIIDANIWIKYARAKNIKPLLSRFISIQFSSCCKQLPAF